MARALLAACRPWSDSHFGGKDYRIHVINTCSKVVRCQVLRVSVNSASHALGTGGNQSL